MPSKTDKGATTMDELSTLSRPAHALETKATLEELSVEFQSGLSLSEAQRRLTKHGANELDQQKGVQPLKILLGQVVNAMTLILCLALAASFGIEAWIEGGILGGIIALNIGIGFVQTLQAERTINSLRTLGSPTCTVLRDGSIGRIPTTEIVPGDVVEVNVGDSVPADMRMIYCVNLEADEAMLTGESLPVTKDPKLILDLDTAPGDRLNVAFSSTRITKGRGRGVVFATGMNTEIGHIAAALASGSNGAKTKQPANILGRAFAAVRRELGKFFGLTVGTPLQQKLSQLFLGLLFFAITCIIIVLGANRFSGRRDVVIYAVTTAIGTIPVSLLLVLTVTMAAGVRKMLERNVLVRNMSSLEALGGITNICSDKTGTITQGRMIVRKAWLPGFATYSVDSSNDVYNPTQGIIHIHKDADGSVLQISDLKAHVGTYQHLTSFLDVASLANLAEVSESQEELNSKVMWTGRGAPTEIAIEVFAQRFGWDRKSSTDGQTAKWQHLAEYPFDSDVKKMTVVYQNLDCGETHILTKGAVERVLDSCNRIFTSSSSDTLSEEHKVMILGKMEALASEGLRVLALARRSIPNDHWDVKYQPDRKDVERDLMFLGLIGIYDPPRPESAISVRQCQEAGIIVHMLTGDHPQTARSIATDVGILPRIEKLQHLSADVNQSLVMTSAEFDKLDVDQIDELPQLPLVVARCSPATKVRMIDALHRRKRYVAMTGDGINDSPSLKRADIGIAMGSGSDVAKEAADIVLTDDNFASILNAIEEGRRIFDNIQKFVLHVLAANAGFVLALLIGLALKDEAGVSVFLLSPIEILFMLLGTGAFCETGLGFETAVEGILQRPPHNLRFGIFTPELLIDTLVYGVLMGALVLGSFTLIIFGFSNGNLGRDCNFTYSASCEPVFHARATCYTAMTWMFVLFAWELIDMRRSFFWHRNGVQGWTRHLWSNQFLSWSVTLVILVVFPVLYVPTLNTVVFLHVGIDWEWAVAVIATVLFIAGSEGWKWVKRMYFRRRVPESQQTSKESV
ncbi:E1-E2 ATPase-like protein 11 [Elsinoe fawcettii]|nr:E1-E2 ATPase-like protein 11 [Elsinoe fawcettii]